MFSVGKITICRKMQGNPLFILMHFLSQYISYVVVFRIFNFGLPVEVYFVIMDST